MRGLRQAVEPLGLLGRVVRKPNLRRLELAWAATNLASRSSAIAVAVYAFETSGAGAVGLLLFVRLLLAAVASPWLALLADRRPRRQVMIGSELVRGLMLGGMAALAHAGTARFAVYALAVLVAVPEPLFRSAQAAVTPSLVDQPEELTAANVIASAVESVGLFAGPALGALLLALSSTATVFAVAAGLLLVSIVLVARISVRREPAPVPSAVRSLGWLAGWRTIASEPGLRVVTLLYSTQTLVAGMLNVLVVVVAIQLLDLGTAGVGWLDGMVGVGALLGILVVAGAAGRQRLSGYFGLGLVLWSAPLLLIAAWPEPGLAFLLLTLVGIGNTLVDVTGVTLMQRGTPDEVLGRVFGAFEALVLLSMGLGSLLAPLLSDALGVRAALLAAGCVLLVALALLWRPLDAVDLAARAPSDRVELLRGVPIFGPLPAPELERLATALEEVGVAGGSTVVREGEPGHRFYVIAEGQAAVEQAGWTVAELGPGDFFGEIALLRNVPRTATIRALTTLRLFALERDTFVGTVTRNPASAETAGTIVAARLPGPVIP